MSGGRPTREISLRTDDRRTETTQPSTELTTVASDRVRATKYVPVQRPVVSEHFDGGGLTPDDIDDTPTVTCHRCDREWSLEYELDTLRVGNQAIERFALDHKHHTGHFPDDVRPWGVNCTHCPDGDEFLRERPARRWAETHARHTGHEVTFRHADGTSTTIDTEAI